MSQECTTLSIDQTFGMRHVGEQVKVYHLIVLVLCGLAVIISLYLHQDGNGLRLFGIQWPISCALYESFGIKCALCGLTRSFCAMAAGEFSTAAHFHLLGPAIFLFVCMQIPYRIHALWATHEANGVLQRAGLYLAIGLAGGLLINWLVYLGGLIL